jgi:hypothetical protein
MSTGDAVYTEADVDVLLADVRRERDEARQALASVRDLAITALRGPLTAGRFSAEVVRTPDLDSHVARAVIRTGVDGNGTPVEEPDDLNAALSKYVDQLAKCSHGLAVSECDRHMDGHNA